MYSDSDLEGAVAAGVMRAEDAAAFRNHIAGTRDAPLVDEESFRLLTGFNDIFVAIATVILLGAIGWIGGRDTVGIGGFAVAAVSWMLAEYFTRRRRMALPSIILLLAFVGGIFAGFADLLLDEGDMNGGNGRHGALLLALSAGLAGVGAWCHWRRFHVPITIAAGAAAATGLFLALLASAIGPVDQFEKVMLALVLAAGIAVFLFAMWWDMSDPRRETRRSDVAFWLHLLAAPLIVHPVFALLGLTSGDASPSEAVIVLLVYLALGVTALTIDRRALLVSALAYVLWALSDLFERLGAIETSLAFTALIIGSALLLLSAFWQSARHGVVALLPDPLRVRLPATDQPLSFQPAS